MRSHDEEHWEPVKWIFRYVKGMDDRGLVFDRDKAATCDVEGLLILIIMVTLIKSDTS